MTGGGAECLREVVASFTIDARHLADMRSKKTIVHEFGQGLLQRRRHDLPAMTLSLLEHVHQATRHDGVTAAYISEHRFRERADIKDTAGFVEPL